MSLLSTQKLSKLLGLPVQRINDFCAAGILNPQIVGRSRVWRLTEALAVGTGQTLLAMGIHGAVRHRAMQLIASHSEGDMERVVESRPILMVLPGVGVADTLMSREQLDATAGMYLSTTGVAPLGIDLAWQWSAMRERIAELDAAGWPTSAARSTEVVNADLA